jgi:uncharacterized protein (TIGR02588 family)
MVDDVSMRGRALVWITVGVAACGVAGLGAYLAVAGLTEASAVAGVIVAFVELAALVVGIYGVTRERRSAGGSQAVAGTSVGGDLRQVRAVKGNVRVRRAADGPLPSAPPPPAVGGLRPGDGQSVTNSWVSGHLGQVDDVGGDADLE